jgi:hypothetical protein
LVPGGAWAKIGRIVCVRAPRSHSVARRG